MFIRSAELDPTAELSLTQQALSLYHARLGAGWTGGLVVDRFRGPPGSAMGVVADDGHIEPALAAALQSLTQRAARWGPRLQGATARPVTLPSTPPTAGTASANGQGQALALVELQRGPRRFLLVHNRSQAAHVRQRLAVPVEALGTPMQRVVEVPASSAEVAGWVVRARDGWLRLNVDLRPGDAVLFEVF